MEQVTKKGDMLFIGEDEDTLAVIVLDSIQHKGSKFLKVVAMPIMVDKILDESKTDAEYAREIVDGEKYFLDPVTDPKLAAELKDAFNKKNEANKEPSKN